jgi:flagellin-like hook-associated protein FlgL
MKTIRTKVYQFNELTEQAKEVAINWYRNTDSGDYSFAWDNVKDDAKEIGLKIIEISDHRKNSGEFMLAANEVAQNIFNNHGEGCDTYKTAQNFMEQWQPVFNNYMDENHEDYESNESEDTLQELEDDFLQALLEDYRIMYNADIDYQSSDEYIIDQITANEYDFTADGKRFNQ